MNAKRSLISVLLISLIVLAVAPAFVHAQELSLLKNLQSGKTFENMGNFLKGSVFKWYTTTGNVLNPQYETQRKMVDSVLFFIIVFASLFAGLRKTPVFKDLKGAGVAFAVAATIFFINYFVIAAKFSIGGFLVQNVKYIAVAFIALIIYLLLTAFFKPKTALQKILALLVGIGLAILLMTQIGGGFGFNPESPAQDLSEDVKGIQAQLAENPTDPALQEKSSQLNYQQALINMQRFKYADAKENIANVLEMGPLFTDGKTNAYWPKALDLAEEKLFAHMSANQILRIRGELAIATIWVGEFENLRDRIQSPKTPDEEKKLLNQQATDAREKAEAAVAEAKKLETELDNEIKEQKVRIQRIEALKGK